MKQLHQFSRILTGRIALNIYFWLFYALLVFGVNFYASGAVYHYAESWYTLFRIITTLISFAVIYTNNLWLVPRYLNNRRVGRYFSLMLLVCYSGGLLMSVFFRYLDVHFPGIVIADVSMVETLKVTIGYTPAWLVFAQALSWVVGFLLFIIVFTAAWFLRDYTRQIRRRKEAQEKQVETELKFLKSQINPHFLFNTLNNLYTLTVLKADSAPDTVSRLSVILRYMLYESNVPLVSFEKEKEIMQAYIELELLRLGQMDDLHFTITADADYKVPPLLWMSVLENVFKHGTRFLALDYFIDYRVDIANSRMTIYSKNRFKEGSDNKLEKSSGIGLANLRKRLELLFPGKHTISASADGNYYITQITVNLL